MEPAVDANGDALRPRRGLVGGLVHLLAPPADAPPIADEAEVRATYRYWRRRVLATTTIGYALYYFLRKNLSVAMPAMERSLGISKSDLGLFLTLHGVIYGFSKFINGMFGDRADARRFMALGLALAAVCNLCFGFSTTVLALGVFWMLNGWVQGMGFPPCARSMSHWFSPSERATKFALWNTSHSIGAAGVLVLTSMLVAYDWRLCFFVPAAIGIAGAWYIYSQLRDTPGSLGLPEIEDFRGDRASLGVPDGDVAAEAGVTCVDPVEAAGPELTQTEFVVRRVLANPLVWAVSLANFFVYVVRYVILDWGPSFLTEAKHVELGHAGLMVACFEIGGIIGAVAGGVLTDRVFRSYAGRACVAYMAICTALVWLFWRLPSESVVLNSLLLAAIGFFIYGPQCLVGVIGANLGTKRATATTIGLTGLFGYASTVLSGWGFGKIVESHGWHAGLEIVIICSGVAVALFALLWNVNAETELTVKRK